MPYVSRGEDGKISGAFANKQSGFAEEWLEEDDPEYLEWLNAPPPPAPPTPEEQILFDHENRLRSMEGQPPLELRDFITEKKRLGP